MPIVARTLLLLLLLPQEVKATSSFDKKAEFGAFETYAWDVGLRAYDPVAHKTIADAMDAHMAALDRVSADAVLKYHTVRGPRHLGHGANTRGERAIVRGNRGLGYGPASPRDLICQNRGRTDGFPTPPVLRPARISRIGSRSSPPLVCSRSVD
jgi:hypothetical protein